jgi:hypothetical protein
MRLLATGQRLGQRTQRQPSQRHLSRRQVISRLLHPVRSLRPVQQMGRHRNEAKDSGAATVLVKNMIWLSRVVGV